LLPDFLVTPLRVEEGGGAAPYLQYP
jgi:hypothetical protein